MIDFEPWILQKESDHDETESEMHSLAVLSGVYSLYGDNGPRG